MKFKPNLFQELFIRQELFSPSARKLTLRGIGIFDEKIDFQRLVDAVNQVIHDSDIWKIHWTGEEWSLEETWAGIWQQEDISFLEQHFLDQALSLSNLWDIRLIQSEKPRLLVKLHHALFDGHSFGLLWEDIHSVYSKKTLKNRSLVQASESSQKYSIETGHLQIVEQKIARLTYNIPLHRWQQFIQMIKTKPEDPLAFFIDHIQNTLNQAENYYAVGKKIGLAVRNRMNAEHKNSYLAHVNFLPLTNLDLKTSEKIKYLFRNQDIPLLKILENHSASAAFDVLFSWQKENYQSDWNGSKAEVQFLEPLSDENALGIHILEYTGQNFVQICLDYPENEYHTDWLHSLFKFTMAQMLASLNDQKSVSFTPKLSTAGGEPIPISTLFDYFNQTCLESPDKTALVFKEKSWSFKDIQLQLFSKKLPDSEKIFIPFERNENLIISILSAWAQEKTICLFDQFPDIQSHKKGLYLAKTTGSTGKPKWIEISVEAALFLIPSWKNRYQNTNTVHLSWAWQGFDVFLADILRSILSGNTLILPDAEERLNPNKLADLMIKNQVSHVEMTPSFALLLKDFLPQIISLKYFILGSEMLHNSDIQSIKVKTKAKLINSYGLTEAGIDSCAAEISEVYSKISSGKLFNGQKAWIVSNQQIQAIGLPGELIIGGSGLGIPEILDEKWIQIESINGYKTGDYALMNSKNEIFILGRMNQDFVKISGKRISLTEMESLANELVDFCSCLIIENMIVCFFCGERTEDELRQHFENQQVYFPEHYQKIDQWPLNQQGKTDKKALESFFSLETKIVQFPETPEAKILEQAILNLNLSIVSLEKTWQSQAWSSLQLIRLLQQLKTYQYSCSLLDLMKFKTPSGLIQWMKENKDSEIVPSEPLEMQADDDLLDDILSVLNQ